MIIKNGKIFGEDAQFNEGDLYISEDKITKVNQHMAEDMELENSQCKENKNVSNRENNEEEIIDATGLYVIPGLTDIHFHACVGYDFCDGTKEAIEKMAEYELKNGITTICPASMTFSEEQLTEIFTNAAQYDSKEGATLVGINMEGPFISMEKKGAQNPEYIHKPDGEMFKRLQKAAGGLIKLVDIAPETEDAMEFIDEVKDIVNVSLAHTCADFKTAQEAFNRGACHVTHLYNAMPPYSHREPGVIGAACDDEKVMVEIICDGIHLHPATVRTTYKMFGEDRVILISDSMMACGLEDGSYTLGGQDVTVKGKLATLTKEGNIAGSVTNLMNCVRTAVKEMEIPLEKAIKSATINPAKAINIYDKYGSLTAGKVANIVLLDENLEIKHVIKEGKIVNI